MVLLLLMVLGTARYIVAYGAIVTTNSAIETDGAIVITDVDIDTDGAFVKDCAIVY